MTARLLSIMRSALAGALALVCAGAPARADDPQIGQVRVGFTGAPIEERWFPLRVAINPGGEPVQAVLTVEVQQDGTSRTRTMTPVASAPGVVSVVSVPVCMAREAREITLTLSTGRGRQLHTRTLQCATTPNEPDEMAYALPPESPVVATLLGPAGPTPEAIAGAFPTGSLPMSGGRTARTLTDATLTPADMPDAWLAYQGASVVLVRGSDALKLDSRQLGALRQWVLFGGRLIIIADAPGQEWAAWLPPVVAGGLTLSDATREGAWPDTLARRATDSALLFAGAQRRWITLGPDARAAGWVLHDQRAPGRDQPGLMAVGPVGFGVVTIVGFDPSVAVVPGATAALESVWRHILTEPSGGWSWLGVGGNTRSRFVVPGSGETEAVSRAIKGAMDATVVVPPVSETLVVGLGIILLALALMLGPGDRYILGRLGLRHRSWISGPLWIALGGVLMLIIPDLARSAQTTVARCQTIDILCPPPDGPGASAPALAVSTDLRAAFAARSMDVAWPNLPEGAFVRGVSAAGRDYFRGNSVARASARPHEVLARSAEGGSADPFGGFAPVPASGSASCMPATGMTTSLRRWSLRSVLVQARVQATLTAVALETGSGRVVRVSGIGPTDELIGASVNVGGMRGAAVPQRTTGDAVEIALPAPGEPVTGWWWQPPGQNLSELLNGLDAFPGVPAREGSVAMRLDGGRYAHVLLAVRHGAPEEAMTGAAATAHITLYRLLVPLPAPTPKPDRAPAEMDNAETGS